MKKPYIRGELGAVVAGVSVKACPADSWFGGESNSIPSFPAEFVRAIPGVLMTDFAMDECCVCLRGCGDADFRGC